MLERRRSPRYEPEGEVYARIKSSIPVRIVDVSEHGMQVESSSALPPAGQCDIWLPAADGDVRMRVRVQRCRARFMKSESGDSRGLVYFAGIEFLEVDAAARSALGGIVRKLTAPGEGGEDVGADGSGFEIVDGPAGVSKAAG
jgi:hypothetical protein